MPKDQPFKICLTGGGTAGHVVPHFALYPEMLKRNWQVFYIGSNAIEKELVTAKGIEFKTITAGKLRRYISFKNFIDIFKVGIGFLQAVLHLLFNRPNVLFSKGGFVAVPVAIAAWVLRIPVVSHESDVTPGLANKIIKPFAKKLLVTFPETIKLVGPKSVHVGTPIRQELFTGDRVKGLKLCGFSVDSKLPTMLVMGGSQGALKINTVLEESLPELVKKFRIVHLSGRGKVLSFSHENYCGFEYVSEGLEHIFALADFVISRAGANAIFEFLALNKPMLLIPLSEGTRGDQIVNAKSFAKQGFAAEIDEGQMDSKSLISDIDQLIQHQDKIRAAQKTFDGSTSLIKIIDQIEISSSNHQS
jgi:UDP-N-acetylglucosamine--N-acetylmuramyl-(pentapeptide) pyrophosphoryl-undecaprenol N-acetylglucosamine transferase